MKTAIAYVTDTLLCPASGVSRREEQRERIRRHAAEHDIEIVAWYEDEMCNVEAMARSGLSALLAHRGSVDIVLLDHVWSVSREWAKVKRFAEAVALRGWTLETVQTGWDAVSQMARRYFHPERFVPAVLRRVRPTRGARPAADVPVQAAWHA